MSTSFNHVVTQENQNLFTEITNDINPLHLDENYAKSIGRGAKVEWFTDY